MVIHEDCNLCARIKKWHDSLSKETKFSLNHENAENTEEIATCCVCNKTRPGSNRLPLKNRWICNICFWRHAFLIDIIDLDLL